MLSSVFFHVLPTRGALWSAMMAGHNSTKHRMIGVLKFFISMELSKTWGIKSMKTSALECLCDNCTTGGSACSAASEFSQRLT